MKHLGITHKRGDDSYEYESRCMLGQLDARMRVTRQAFGAWSRQLQDGTIVSVSIIKNGPVPICRAVVSAPVLEEVPDILITGPVLEHGMMFWTGPSQTTPIDVWHTAWVSDYVDGGGTNTPVQSYIQYLIGPRGVVDEEISWSPNSEYWQYSPYKSQIWTDQGQWDGIWPVDDQLQVNTFTGLMRLYIQCLLGANITPSVALAGTYPSGQTDGVFRLWDSTADTYQYWFVRIANSGVQVVPLETTVEGAEVLGWLNAHKRGDVVLAEETWRLYDAWVMRDLTRVAAFATIIAQVDMADVTEDGAIPIAHGWAYSRQKLGGALEDVAIASIVTHKSVTSFPSGEYELGESHWEAKRFQVTFTLDNGVLSATKQLMEGPLRWVLSSTPAIWCPIGSEYHRLEHPINTIGTGPVDADVPIYVFWSDEKEECLRFDLTDIAESTDSGNLDPIYTCGGGSGSRERSTQSTRRIGRPYVSGVSPPVTEIVTGGLTTKTFNVTATGTITCGDPALSSETYIYNWYLDKYWCEWPEDSMWDHDRNPSGKVKGQFTWQMCHNKEELDEYVSYLWDTQGVAVLTPDPEAFYVASYLETWWRNSNFVWERDSQLGGDWYWENRGSGSFTLYNNSRGAWWGSPSSSGVCAGTVGMPDSLVSVDTETGATEISQDAWLITANGTFNFPNGSFESFFFEADVTTQGLTLDCFRSYYDGAGFYAQGKNDWVVTDGLPIDPGVKRVMFPLGAV